MDPDHAIVLPDKATSGPKREKGEEKFFSYNINRLNGLRKGRDTRPHKRAMVKAEKTYYN